MEQSIAALIGVVLGFILPSLASLIRSKTIGTRFESAIEAELEEARDNIHRKALWVSREESQFKTQRDERLLVEWGNKLLFLGEEEDFFVTLPFWEQNIRDVVEVLSTKSFKRVSRDVSLIRKFVSKFREMKMAFKVVDGDYKQMAVVCYRDLIEIHDALLPDKALGTNPHDPKRGKRI